MHILCLISEYSEIDITETLRMVEDLRNGWTVIICFISLLTGIYIISYELYIPFSTIPEDKSIREVLSGEELNSLCLIFALLMESKLTTVQELLILEVALRIINADEKVEENEKWLFRILRSKLRVHNETIIDRFGQIRLLFDKDFKANISHHIILYEYSSKFELPDIVNLEEINFDNIKIR